MLCPLPKTNKKNGRKEEKKNNHKVHKIPFIYIYIHFNNKVTLAINEQRKGDKESLTYDTSTSLVKTGVHGALKHTVCVNRGY